MLPTSLKACTDIVKARGWLWLAGVALVAGWLAWWALSLQHNRLLLADGLWRFPFPYLAHDLKYNYAAARAWLDAQDPYAPLAEHGGRIFGYPPTMLYFFVWCKFCSFKWATLIWFAFLLTATTLACLACWRWRQRTSGHDLPWPFALAAVLYSMPILFALERGQCDHLVLALLLGAVAALRSVNPWGQRRAGALLALAAAIKLYPGLFLVGLLALRRWQAAVAFVVVGLALALVDADAVLKSRARLQQITDRYNDNAGVQLSFKNHSLTGSWQFLFDGTPAAQLMGRVPGWLAAGTALGSLVGGVSWRLWRAPQRAELALPYFLWLMAAATFFPPVAFDYNLIFRPLALLAVWKRRDPVPIHLAMGLCLLALQPLRLEIGGRLLLCGKLAGLAAAGWCLLRRLHELPAAAPVVPDRANTLLQPPLAA